MSSICGTPMTVPSGAACTRISTTMSPASFFPGSRYQLLWICERSASCSLDVSCWPSGAEEDWAGGCGGVCGGASVEDVCSFCVRFFSSELNSACCCCAVGFFSFALGFSGCAGRSCGKGGGVSSLASCGGGFCWDLSGITSGCGSSGRVSAGCGCGGVGGDGGGGGACSWGAGGACSAGLGCGGSGGVGAGGALGAGGGGVSAGFTTGFGGAGLGVGVVVRSAGVASCTATGSATITSVLNRSGRPKISSSTIAK